MSTQSYRQSICLLPILAILVSAALALPSWGQAAHAPGTQMQTAPPAPAADAHAGYQMPGTQAAASRPPSSPSAVAER
jgi:hypothetical protein